MMIETITKAGKEFFFGCTTPPEPTKAGEVDISVLKLEFMALVTNVRSAMKYLQSYQCLNDFFLAEEEECYSFEFEEEDQNWDGNALLYGEIDVTTPKVFFDVLDKVRFLERGFKPRNREGGLLSKAIAKLNIQLTAIMADMPLWRLVSLNRYRTAVLSHMREKYHDLFPWYLVWSEVPYSTFTSAVCKMAYEECSFLTASAGVPVLVTVGEKDPALKRNLLQDALNLQILGKAVRDAYALNWVMGAEKVSGKFPWTTAVHEVGGTNASMLVSCKHLLNGKDPLESRFRAALCGVGLDRQDRISTLEELEVCLKDGRRPDGFSIPLFSNLQAWASEEISGEDLLIPIFTEWHREMEEISGVVNPRDFSFSENDLKTLISEPSSPQSVEILRRAEVILTP